jgi:hypothetical protein
VLEDGDVCKDHFGSPQLERRSRVYHGHTVKMALSDFSSMSRLRNFVSLKAAYDGIVHGLRIIGGHRLR